MTPEAREAFRTAEKAVSKIIEHCRKQRPLYALNPVKPVPQPPESQPFSLVLHPSLLQPVAQPIHRQQKRVRVGR
jgi:hypothetical protein